ncbi:MAG: flotillin family protein, partial [Sphingomonas sp.]|nr:flotillin family protein [Sphingomonas sp.]
NGHGGSGGHDAGDQNLANAAVSAALRYRAQAPLIDGLMKELGLDGASLDALTKSVAAPLAVLPGAAISAEENQ